MQRQTILINFGKKTNNLTLKITDILYTSSWKNEFKLQKWHLNKDCNFYFALSHQLLKFILPFNFTFLIKPSQNKTTIIFLNTKRELITLSLYFTAKQTFHLKSISFSRTFVDTFFLYNIKTIQAKVKSKTKKSNSPPSNILKWVHLYY